MAPILLTSLLLLLNLACIASSCPQFHEWPGTTDADGQLVCAHIFEGYTCSEESHIVALAQSQQFTATRPTTDVSDGLTFLVRPGCKVLGWSVGLRMKAPEKLVEHQSMSVYPGDWNYTCECFVRDVNFLTCEPREDLHVVRECDFRNSSHVGICPFTLEEKPFRAYDLSDGRRPWLKKELSAEEEGAVKTVLGPLVHVRFGPASGDPNVKANYIRYVPPKTKLVISQRVLVCGTYVLPTPEIDLRHEVYDTAGLVASEVRGIPAGSEADQRTKCNNNMDCHDNADCRFDDEADDYVCQCRNGYIGDGGLDCSPEKAGVTSDAWIPLENLNKSFYFSSTNASRANASAYCQEHGGRLADLDRPKVRVTVRDLARTYFTPRLPSNADTEWWTAAENHVVHFGSQTACFVKWPGNRIRQQLLVCSSDSCINFNSRYSGFGTNVRCENGRRFICEKDGHN